MSTSQVWRATEWLLAFGPLTPTTALDYFLISPFFDRTSNNAQLRMQMQFSRGGMEGVDEEAELRRFVGSEYAVVHSAPPGLFIIHKRDRSSPTQVETTAVYYILNDNVYQGPTLYSVVNERIASPSNTPILPTSSLRAPTDRATTFQIQQLTSLHSLSTSLSLIQSSKPTWTPERLYEWDIKEPSSSAIPLSDNKRPHDAVDDTSDTIEKLKIEGEEDEDTVRPAETFNPLLFRALQTVAKELEGSQPPPVDPNTNQQQQQGVNGGVAAQTGTPGPNAEEGEGAGTGKKRGKK